MENWQNFLESTVQRCRNTRFYERFSEAPSNEERTRLVLEENLTDVNWINHYFDEIRKNDLPENLKKCSITADRYRQEGNTAFKHSRDTDALNAYNKCVLYAPCSQSGMAQDSLALGLANRSAVLFRLRKYQQCLADIDSALLNGYPRRLQHKVWLRKAKCYLHLGRQEEAEKACQTALNKMDSEKEVSANQRKTLHREIEDLQNKLAATDSGELKANSESHDASHDSVPGLSYGPGRELKNATSAVNLTWTKEKGRHVVANNRIHPGDTLIRERPYAGVLLPDYYTTHCHHCYGLVLVAHPCDNCARVRFCSTECRTEALKKYHKTECRFLLLLHCIGVAHLALRIVLVAGLDFLKEFSERISLEKPRKSEGRFEGLDESGEYDTSYRAVYHLVTHVEDMEKDDVIQYTLTAVLLLRCLRESGYFHQVFQSSSPGGAGDDLKTRDLSLPDGRDSGRVADDEVLLGSLILRHMCQIICNAHAITELQAAQVDATALVSAQSQVRIATALYPTSSLCNHACQPSFINSFHKDMLVVRAVREINPGEEIYNCYGPHARRMPRPERQRALREQYFFTCTCKACEEEEQVELRHQALRCQSCDGVVGMPSKPEVTCTDCGRHVPEVTSMLAQAEVAREKFIQGVVLLDQGNISDAVRTLNRVLKTQQKVLYRYNRDLAETHDALARCHASNGNFIKSAEHLKVSVSCTEEIYGDQSIELANELQKYAEVLLHCQERRCAAETATRARDIFLIHYGPGHQSVEELSQLLHTMSLS